MRDRFLLAILASIAMHLLLLEMVVALELLWPTARQADERQFIPVALLEMANPADPLKRQEGSAGGSSQPSSLDRPRPAKHAWPDTAAPRRVPDKPKTRFGGSVAGSAKAIPPPAEDPTCVTPTDRLLPEAEDRQKQAASPEVAVAAAPAADLPPAGLPSPRDADRCVTAEIPVGAGAGVDSAAGGSSRGAEAGYGGQGSGKSGEGAILIPGEFLAGNPPPRYPLIARRKGWEGTVVIDIHVSNTGWVQEARVDKSSGYTVLDDAALGAVRNWRIALHGRPAETGFKFRIPVIFKLTPS